MALLSLAHERGCEAALARELEDCLDAGNLPDVEDLARTFAPRPQPLPEVRVELGSLADYDALLPESASATGTEALAGSVS